MLETSFVGRLHRVRSAIRFFLCSVLPIGAMTLTLAACDHHGSEIRYGGTTFPISGTIAGLDAAGLILQNNGEEALTVAADATSFQFGPVAAGGSYAVTVSAQPAGLTCTVSNGSGTVVSAAVSNVSVSCSPTTYPIAGTITGLGGATGLVLQNNGGDDLTVAASSSSFQFATPVAAGSSYNVTVATQPAGLTCTVSHGTSSQVGAPVTDISIVCNTSTYMIAGAISGLVVSGLVLQNNGGDDLTVNANATAFQFAAPVAAGGGYDITVLSAPTGMTCTINNGTGLHVTADVGNVQITCSASTFTVGGSITGLTGSGLVLQNNGGDNLIVPAHATSFQFTTPVAYGASSTATVQSQPTGQICSVTNGSGIVDGNVTNVAIDCTDIITHTLTASAGVNGSISPSGSISVNDGDDQGFTATPDAGWAIDRWTLDGVLAQTGGTVYQLTNVKADHVVAVAFGQVTLTPSVASLALAVGAISRQITLTNTGSVAADNLALNYPTWPAGTSASSTCGSTLASGASCTITIAPGATATADCKSDTIDVTADNASTTQVDVVVLDHGCLYQGGYLAVIDDTTPAIGSIGGLVAATADLGSPLDWGNLFFSTANSLTDGAANTAVIVDVLRSNGGNPYAAGACDSLTDGSYSDWYLPAQDQLLDSYNNLIGDGSLSPGNNYWSSTQLSPMNASALIGGVIADLSVFTVNSIRCVRTIN